MTVSCLRTSYAVTKKNGKSHMRALARPTSTKLKLRSPGILVLRGTTPELDSAGGAPEMPARYMPNSPSAV